MNFDVVSYLDTLIGSPKPEKMTFDDAAEYFGAKGLRYEIEERAAILQHDGGLKRDAAEKQAAREMFVRDFPDV